MASLAGTLWCRGNLFFCFFCSGLLLDFVLGLSFAGEAGDVQRQRLGQLSRVHVAGLSLSFIFLSWCPLLMSADESNGSQSLLLVELPCLDKVKPRSSTGGTNKKLGTPNFSAGMRRTVRTFFQAHFTLWVGNCSCITPWNKRDASEGGKKKKKKRDRQTAPASTTIGWGITRRRNGHPGPVAWPPGVGCVSPCKCVK